MKALMSGGIVGTALSVIALGVLLVRRRGISSRVDSQMAPPARDRENLEDFAKNELYERARKADIAGRSKMSKEGLIKALRAAAS